MPKQKGRKRKTERSNESVGSKKSKCDKTQKDSKKSQKAKLKPEKCLSDEPIKAKEEDRSSLKDVDIDAELDHSASKSNLSVFNVKSIIHHVLSDERVIAMVCKAAEGDQNEEEEPKKPDVTLPKVVVTEEDGKMCSIIEPKLTRSKFREVAQSTGTLDPLILVKETINRSPLKRKVSPLKTMLRPTEAITLSLSDEDNGPKLPLADIKFSEEAGSSDEEYDPIKEGWGGSEEDSESCISSASDLASPEPLRRTSRVKRRLLPDVVSSPQQAEADKNDDSVNLGQMETIASPFKVPYPITRKSEEQIQKENADLIATRTRSRLPLNETSLESLEASFVPPDFIPVSINIEELDSEDIDWHKWLFGLTAEKGATPDTEDPEDSEYNFMAEDLKEEQEEYRNDRAVKVSQKELTELFQEFLAEFADEIAESEGKISSSLLPTHDSEVLTSEGDAGITIQQIECLIGQLQQHTQLLVQVHLLAKEHPSLQEEAMTCHTFIDELLQQYHAASNANVCRLLENQNIPPSVFSYVGLEEAARIINPPPVACATSEVSCTNIAVNNPSDKEPPIPEKLTEIFVSSPVFVYTGLLPHIAFRSRRPKTKGAKFLPCEDNLLVLGISEFDSNWYQIQVKYLPTKSTKQIQIRKKNLCSSRAPDNVVKQLKQTGELPPLPVFMTFKVSADCQRIFLPSGNKLNSLPAWLKTRYEAQAAKKENDNREAKKKQGRKKKKVSDDVVVANKEFPVVYTPLKAENVVRIQPKEPISIAKTPSCSDHSPKATAVSTDSNRNEKNILETLATKLPQESTKTKSPVTPKHKETLNNSTALDENGIEPINDTESHLPEVVSRVVDSPTTRIKEVSEKENLEPACMGQSCDDLRETASSSHDDTKIRHRAVAFAQFYLNTVKKRLKHDRSTYQSFLKVLLNSKSENWTPVTLYKEVSDVLEGFPELVRDFVGFLEPHQALEAGVFMTNNELFKAREFLKRIETHFQKNPSYFQKIIKVFTQFNFKKREPGELYDTVVPLLKGQQYLIEEFDTFFNHLQPPSSNSEDFEEVELASGSDVEVDDFEEVRIPDVFHNRNVRKTAGKGKCSSKTDVKLPGSRKQSYSNGTTRKGNKMKKRDSGSKNNEENFRDLEKRTRECDADGEVGVVSEVVNGNLKDVGEIGGSMESGNGDCEKKITDSDEDGSGCGKIKDDENKDGVANESCNAKGAMSPARKYGSDRSNESSPASESVNAEDYFESPGTTQGSHMTSTSEGTSDLSNEAYDAPTTPDSALQPADQFVDERTGTNTNIKLEISKHEEENCSPKPAEDTVKEEHESPRRKSTGLLKESGELVKEEPDVCHIGQDKESDFHKISANNLELDSNGKSVIVWTREDDKKILEVYQSRGSSETIYNEIAQELGNKTADQVEGRFRSLVKLLNADSSSEESGSEADDESYDELEGKEWIKNSSDI